MTTKAQIRTILKMAARNFAPYMDEFGNIEKAKPATVYSPTEFNMLDGDEKQRLLKRIEQAIADYFEKVGIPNERAREYYDAVVGYLMGAAPKPEIRELKQNPMNQETVKIDRPNRRRPGIRQTPVGKTPFQTIKPNASWYSKWNDKVDSVS